MDVRSLFEIQIRINKNRRFATDGGLIGLSKLAVNAYDQEPTKTQRSSLVNC